MEANNQGPEILKQFPAVSTEQWEAKIAIDLKGADYEKKLIWNTMEGFKVRPYYRAEDLHNLEHLSADPGAFPFTRGEKSGNDWLIRQDIVVTDVLKANAVALNVLNKGVESLGFVVNATQPADDAFFSALLKDIDFEAAEVNFCGSNLPVLAKTFMKWAGKNSINTSKVTFDYDPLGFFTLHGVLPEKKVNATSSVLKTMMEQCNGVASIVSIHGDIIHNSGSSIVQELGFSLAMAVEYLDWMTKEGIDAQKAAEMLRFNFSIGSSYFMEIAKLRAARTLWAQILLSYGVAEEDQKPMTIHSVTSDWNKTVYDPYVNMLRSTTEAMSGALGGTHSLTVKPFDAIFRTPNEFSERIARNQQLLIREESYFDKVADPGAGSYYIENLTESILSSAWDIFLTVQNEGGYYQAFVDGKVQELILATSQKRDLNIATRRVNVLGTNQFPNFNEEIESNLDENALAPTTLKAADAVAEPLTVYRGSMAFEVLRNKTDQYAKTNRRPKAFMLTIGNLAMRKARAQFACNFFACAGFEVVDNNGFKTVEDGIDAAMEANADIVVICSSDDEYVQLAPKALNFLGEDGVFVVAGYPKAAMASLTEQGVSHFIHVKTNVLESLTQFQKLMGIE